MEGERGIGDWFGLGDLRGGEERVVRAAEEGVEGRGDMVGFGEAE